MQLWLSSAVVAKCGDQYNMEISTLSPPDTISVLFAIPVAQTFVDYQAYLKLGYVYKITKAFGLGANIAVRKGQVFNAIVGMKFKFEI